MIKFYTMLISLHRAIEAKANSAVKTLETKRKEAINTRLMQLRKAQYVFIVEDKKVDRNLEERIADLEGVL